MFPRPNTERIVIFIAATQGLISAQRDAVSISTEMSKFKFRSHIIIDNKSQGSNISSKLKGLNVNHTIHNTLDVIESIIPKNKRTDVLLTISGHGYSQGKGNNYFIFNGHRINRQIMRQWFRSSEAKFLVLIDTCHSQNMVGFQIPELVISDSSSLCISGCRQSQSLSEDISEKYGYGGGLVSSFLDSISSADVCFDTKKVAEQCKFRLRHFGVTPTFTSLSIAKLTTNCYPIIDQFTLLSLVFFIINLIYQLF
jgi:hypothetical protein